MSMLTDPAELYARARKGRSAARLENVRLRAEVERLTAALAAERARFSALVAAGDALAGMYIRMIDSGDCGSWDPRLDAEVIAWRAARQEGG